MILFDVKNDGTVKTVPMEMAQGSTLADLVVIAEAEYALVTMRLVPPSGLYIPDIIFARIKVDGAIMWKADLPADASITEGQIKYQIFLTDATGEVLETPEGRMTIPKGVLSDMPETVEHLKQYTINELYTLLSGIHTEMTAVDTRLDTLERLIRYSRIEIEIEDDFLNNQDARLTIQLPDTLEGYDYAAILIADDPWTLKWAQRLELTVESVAVSGTSVTATISREPATGEWYMEDECFNFTCVAFLTPSSGSATATASFVGMANFPHSVEGQVVINTVTLTKSSWTDTYYGDKVMVFGPNWGEYEEVYSYNRVAAITLYPLDEATREEAQRLGLTATANKYSAGLTYVFIKKGDQTPNTSMRFLAVLTGADATNEDAESEVPVYVAGVAAFPAEVWEEKVNGVVGERLEEIDGRMKLLKATVSKTMWSDTHPWNADILLMADMVNPIVLVIPADEATREESQNLEVSVAQYNPNEFSLHIYLKRSSSLPIASPTIDLVYYLLLLNPPDLPDGFVPVAEFVGVVNLPDELMSREVMRVVNANTDKIVEAVLAKIPNGEEMSF